MKKMLLASAFALIGSFAMANEVSNDSKMKKNESKSVEIVEIVCLPIQLSCTEDCYNYDNNYPITIMQMVAEIAAQEEYVCGGN